MQILFEPEYIIGDVVSLKISPGMKMAVDGYSIYKISDAGEVISWSYSLYDEEGKSFYFRDTDLILYVEGTVPL